MVTCFGNLQSRKNLIKLTQRFDKMGGDEYFLFHSSMNSCSSSTLNQY